MAAALLLLDAAPSSAAATGCPRAGTTVLARNAKVVAFQAARGHGVAACSLENGTHIRVSWGTDGERVSHVWVKDRYVLATVRHPEGNAAIRSLQLFDPREGTSGWVEVVG